MCVCVLAGGGGGGVTISGFLSESSNFSSRFCCNASNSRTMSSGRAGFSPSTGRASFSCGRDAGGHSSRLKHAARRSECGTARRREREKSAWRKYDGVGSLRRLKRVECALEERPAEAEAWPHLERGDEQQIPIDGGADQASLSCHGSHRTDSPPWPYTPNHVVVLHAHGRTHTSAHRRTKSEAQAAPGGSS